MLALLPSITEESVISLIAEASTIFLTMKRLIALSFATSTPEASHLTLLTCIASQLVAIAPQGGGRQASEQVAISILTCPRPCFARPLFLLFFVILVHFWRAIDLLQCCKGQMRQGMRPPK